MEAKMKKLLGILTVAFIASTGLFAQAVQADGTVAQWPQGRWTDEKYQADWVFQIDPLMQKIAELYDSNTGELIFTFTRKNIQDFKMEASEGGVTLSWKCAATNRSYKFRKDLTSDKSLHMDIHNDKFNEDYSVEIPFK